jgi:hypothetical protein
MALEVLDPTSEARPPLGQPASRSASLAGKTIGLISNGKKGTKTFFAQFDRLLREEFEVADVIMRAKSNFSAPADKDIVDEIARWQAVITGVGD